MRLGSHLAARHARARTAFVDAYGHEAASVRQFQIDALPVVTWKGKTLRTIRCHGDFGKGPHVQNVPEHLLWSLIDVRQWLCPFHRP